MSRVNWTTEKGTGAWLKASPFKTYRDMVQEIIRRPYAWPGGYAIVLIMDDGCVMCAACAKENYREIAESTMTHARDGWGVQGYEVCYGEADEDGSTYICAHCGLSPYDVEVRPKNEVFYKGGPPHDENF